jgi:hypothetical protein
MPRAFLGREMDKKVCLLYLNDREYSCEIAMETSLAVDRNRVRRGGGAKNPGSDGCAPPYTYWPGIFRGYWAGGKGELFAAKCAKSAKLRIWRGETCIPPSTRPEYSMPPAGRKNARNEYSA